MATLTESANLLCDSLLDGSEYNEEVLDLEDLLESYKDYYHNPINPTEEFHWNWWVSSFYQCYHLLEPEEIWGIQIPLCIDLLAKKNEIYGSDQLKFAGTRGIALRSIDKFHRLKNMRGRGISEYEDESVRDTVIDLFNYSILALLLLKEEL